MGVHLPSGPNRNRRNSSRETGLDRTEPLPGLDVPVFSPASTNTITIRLLPTHIPFPSGFAKLWI
jgi:hypothetical protein